jgi:hypothetical protein
MKKIPYTYEILLVSDRSMEVKYENPDYGVLHVGVRLPYEGESIESVIEEYSPAVYWQELSMPVQTINPGITGSGETVLYDGSIEEQEEIPIEERRKFMVVSRLQAKAIMYQYGILESVENTISQSDFVTQLAWKEAIQFRRLSPLVETLKTEISFPDGSTLTDEILDDMFIQAALIDF